jgi:hypothetical protein
MSLWTRLKASFSPGRASSKDEGIYFYVRCDRCGDRVRVRLNPGTELQQDFAESGAAAGYSVCKMVVDQRCFRPIEVTMRFDAGRRELSREVEGGAFLTREEFEAR